MGTLTTRERWSEYTDAATLERIVEYPSVSAMWKKCTADYSITPAVIDSGKIYTYSELENSAAQMRAVLADAGIKKGDRVGIFAPNSFEFIRGYIAVVTIGAVAAVLPAHFDANTLYGCTLMLGLKAVICAKELVSRTEVLANQAPDVRIIGAADGGTKTAKPVKCEEKDPALIMFTGGTTGMSKGALLSNGAVMQGTVNGCYGVKEVFGQRYLLSLPLSHVFGLIRNLMTSLYTGSTMFICRNNKDMFRDIAVFRPTVIVTVPAIAEMALQLSKRFGKNMLGSDLKYLICGAAPVAPFLVTEYSKIGVTLLPGYGLTETANLVSGNPCPLKKPDSVGIPYPNQEIKTVDGELWVRGKNLMDGYIGRPEDNDTAFSDGWLRTGDLARTDDDGYLYITGRIKEIIVLQNGENVSPAEIEAKFYEIPIIQDCQVFEDVKPGGERILAAEAILRQSEVANLPEGIDVKDYAIGLMMRVNMQLPAFERISSITIRETDFERTPSMKIKRYHKV